MRVGNRHWRTIWAEEDGVGIIDQRLLPHTFETDVLRNLEDAATAIEEMKVRGAPLIGATAAWGMWLALLDDCGNAALDAAARRLLKTRPTAVNLRHGVDRMRDLLMPLRPDRRVDAARKEALAICDEDIAANRSIGRHGADLIAALAKNKAKSKGKDPVHILTHCNAGWLATVDWGTALAPIYTARQNHIDVHVWVDETRPRNQGAFLTAWELAEEGIPHTVIADNSGGYLMAEGKVDMCLVGADRVTRDGSVYNKIGTYLKALAAHDCAVPFYVACPLSTIDWRRREEEPAVIEHRSHDEMRYIDGLDAKGRRQRLRLFDGPTVNPAFDHTPSRLVTGIICEGGIGAPADIHRRFSPDDSPDRGSSSPLFSPLSSPSRT